jgi:hypothetical protein
VIDVFLPERVASLVREAELVEETGFDQHEIEDHETSPTLRRRLAEALVSLGRKIDPEAGEREDTADEAA